MTVTEIELIEESYYGWDLEDIYKKYKTNPNDGLNIENAEIRLDKYGLNEIPKVSKGFIKIYLALLFNWLIVIYLIGAFVIFLASFLTSSNDLFL